MTLPRGPNGHGVYTVISRRPPSDYAYTNGLNAPVSQPRFPHIKDLQAKANPGQGYNPYTPVSTFATVLLSCAHNTDVLFLQIRTLLEQAQQSASQANASISFGKLDRAYVEYLRSSNILLEIIPRHKDFPSLSSDREGWRTTYRSLCKVGDTCSIDLRVWG